MTETPPGATPARSGGRTAWRLAVAILAAGALGGCAIPFGDSPGPESSRPSLREQNSLYLQEQELKARERNQQGGPTVPDRF